MWWLHSHAAPARRVTTPPTLLQQFIKLKDAPDSAIASFVKRFGILGICEHDLPRTHTRARVPVAKAQHLEHWDLNLGCLPGGFRHDRSGRWIGCDDLASYRSWAQEAADIQTLAAAVRHDRAINRDVWKRLTGDASGRSLASARNLVAIRVQSWLDHGSVSPQFSWSTDNRAVVRLGARGTWEPLPSRVSVEWGPFHGTTLFPALALQLTLAVARTTGFAFCSGCGQSYPPKRQPAVGRRSYCDECRQKKVPLRDAQREFRRRQMRRR